MELARPDPFTRKATQAKMVPANLISNTAAHYAFMLTVILATGSAHRSTFLFLVPIWGFGTLWAQLDL
jgi:hypothetical protein